MAASGGQPGNKNARKGREWREAIRRALARDRDALDRLARALIKKAEEGDMTALKEIGDRLDGKAVQAHEHGGPNGEAIPTKIEMVIVDPHADSGSEGLSSSSEES